MSGAPYDKDQFSPFQAFAYEALALSTTAVALTSTVYHTAGSQPAKMALITIENGPARYRPDGTNPTTAVGVPLQSNAQMVVYGSVDMQNMRLIVGAGVTTATAHVEYSR